MSGTGGIQQQNQASVRQWSHLYMRARRFGQDPLDESQRVEVHDDNVYIETDVSKDTARRHQQVPNHRDAVTRPGQSGFHGRTCTDANSLSCS